MPKKILEKQDDGSYRAVEIQALASEKALAKLQSEKANPSKKNEESKSSPASKKDS